MKKLSFSTRLFLTVVTFAIPIVILTYFMYATATSNIAFGEQESKGNRYQRPLEKLLRGVSFHRLLSQRALNGDANARGQLAGLQADIESAFGELQKVNDELKTDLQFTPDGLKSRKRDQYHYEAVRASWTELKSANDSLTPSASVAKHAELIAALRVMITHMGDTSNLILDPDLDSYYLMDVTLLALPQTQDRLQDIIVNVEPMLHSRSISEADRNRLVVYAALLRESDIARVLASADTALNEDGHFYGVSDSLKAKLGPALDEYKATNEKFVAILGGLAEANPRWVAPSEFVAAGEGALASSHSLWSTAVDELDKLLEKRLGSLRDDRSRNLLYAGLALTFALLFSWYIGRSLNDGVRSILASVLKLRDLSTTAASGSANLVDASQQVSAANVQQASAIQETVSTLEEIRALVDRSVDNIAQSAESARTSSKVAAQGKQTVEEMISAIDEINASNTNIMESINHSNARISEIIKVITDIAARTKVINDIVFQTKLLSFNASVEAARAGEHGKGFSVVAEEIGNLATMSGNAANEIGSMLQSSIQKVEEIVRETKSSVEGLVAAGREKVETGTIIARRCGDVLEQVVTNADTVNSMMTSISVAQKEQAQGVAQIAETMNQLDSATHQNVVSAERTSSSAENLAVQAEKLKEIVLVLERELLGRSQDREPSAAENSNVVPLPRKEAARISEPKATKPSRPMTARAAASKSERAVANGTSIPSETDSRFQDF